MDFAPALQPLPGRVVDMEGRSQQRPSIEASPLARHQATKRLSRRGSITRTRGENGMSVWCWGWSSRIGMQEAVSERDSSSRTTNTPCPRTSATYKLAAMQPTKPVLFHIVVDFTIPANLSITFEQNRRHQLLLRARP